MHLTKTQLGWLYGILGTIVFSGYILTNRYVYTHYSVDVLGYVITFTVWAGVFACLSALYNRIKLRSPVFVRSTLPVVTTGIAAGVGVGLVVYGQSYTTAINASIVATASIITTVLFSRLILGERLDRYHYYWIVIMFMGLYLAIVGLNSLHLNKGDLIILAGAVVLGYTNTFSKVLMRQNSSDFVADIRIVAAGLVFLLAGILIMGSDWFVTEAGLWPALGGLFYYLTIKFFYASIHYINPSKAIVIINIHPAITPVLGVWLLSEPYGWSKFLGSALILISIHWITKK